MLRSLRGRLVVAMLLIQVVTLALVVGNSVRLVDALMREVLETKRMELQTLLNVALARPMFEQDPATVNAVLQQVATHETVNAIEVLDRDGHRVATAEHRHVDDSRLHVEPSEVAVFETPLELAGRQVGQLKLSVSDEPLIVAKEALLGQSIAISATAAAAGLAAMLLVAGLLTRDLSALRTIAGRVAGGDYTPRLALRGASETTAVSAAFNSMLEAIGHEREQLHASEARLEAAQRLSHVGCFERDLTTGGGYWTDEMYRLFGIEPASQPPSLDEVIATIHPEDRERLRLARERELTDHDAWEGDFRIYRADGALRHHHVRMQWIDDADRGPGVMLGTVQDVTERVEAERSLRQTAQQLAEAERLAQVGSFTHDLVTGQAFWTDEMFRLIGLEPAPEPPPMEEIASYIHPDDRERITWARDHGFGDGDSWEGEFRMHRADGATRYHHIRMQWRFDANGRPTTLMGTVQDVTERVEAEQSLRQTAQQLAEAERLAQVGSFTRDLRSDTAIWSDELYRIFGLPTTGPALDIAEIESYVHPDDLAQFRESRRTALRERRPWQGTFRVYRADGTLRVHQTHTQIRLGPDGQPEALIGAVQDVTDRTEAERELRKTASQLAEAERLAQVGYWEWEPETDRREWSEEVFRILDLPPDSEPTLETFMARVHPRDRAAVEAETTRNVEELAPIQHSYRIVTSDGAVRHLETIAQPVARGDGTVEKIVGAMRDITELVDAADRVRRGEATLRAVFENLPAAAALKDMDGRYVVANGRYSEWFGTPPRDMIGKTALEVFADEDDTPRVVAMDRTVADTGKAVQEDFEFTFADGSRRPCMALKFPVNGDDGEPIGIGLLLFDISERKRTRAALERSEATLRAVFENLPAVAALKDRDGRYVVANGRYDTWFGHDPVDMVGKTQHEVYTHAEDTGRSLALDAAVIEHGKAVQEDLEFNFADGSRRPVTCLKFPVTGGDGEPLGVGALTFDITERHRVREALERSEAQLRALFDNVLDLIAVVDGEGRILTQSPSTQAVIGYAEDEVAGQVCFDYVHPEDVEASRQALAGIVGNQGETASFRARAHHKDGRWRTMDFLARNALDVPGIEGIVVVGRDVTERLGLEEQLLQAHKMEAVGQLTGGLAHDFNNLLAIVIINLELAREDIADESPVALLLDKAVRAANRGASLTDTLLAFSRRQALSPQVIEPNRTIAGLLELIGGTLGESIDVRCRPADKVWRTRVDVAQLENALLNLAINARDAMPDGGILSIATANRPLSAAEAAAYDLAPGDYVEITVADTGHGIPAEILDRVAEPFFTTKDVGTGSGLGLSMAYGFARQSGGHLAIGSTPGDGVTVRLLLPRTQEAPTPEPIAVEPPPAQAERPLTILVVEDDADVRAATVANLKRLGYDVVSAADAAEALKILASERELALMFTDIVLPGGVNGTELATRARHLRRDLPILFASGYANTDLPPELIGDSVPLLKKPYRTAALAQAVYDCLGGGNERSTTPADRR